MAEPLIAVRGLSKSFGGLRATDRVDLDVEDGETRAIIGPNGAGKTTLIGQLAGDLRPDAGTTRFAGRDVTSLDAPARSRLGLALSFQITSIFPDFSALDNVALAVQAHSGHSFRFWRPARAERELREPALAVLGRVGLGARADVLAANLAHGEQRQLEIAMALATRPRLLLLDEPVAGMGLEETQRMVRLLSTLKRRVTIVLVEHDMDAVFTLADRISVMVYGRIIATGSPEEVRGGRGDPWTVEKVFALFPQLATRQRILGGALSGGEQQMLAIGRALMTNPRLLICDEATEGLAPLVRSEIWRCLKHLKARGQSILLIDKDLAALTRVADAHYILEKGQIVWSGTSAELRAREDIHHRYLGV